MGLLWAPSSWIIKLCNTLVSPLSQDIGRKPPIIHFVYTCYISKFWKYKWNPETVTVTLHWREYQISIGRCWCPYLAFSWFLQSQNFQIGRQWILPWSLDRHKSHHQPWQASSLQRQHILRQMIAQEHLYLLINIWSVHKSNLTALLCHPRCWFQGIQLSVWLVVCRMPCQ